MKGQDSKQRSFGKTFLGVEEIKKIIAKLADEKYKFFHLGEQSSENFIIPALLSGMGTGKSSMLDHHLEALREHCTDTGLKALLERAPLVLSITLNSKMGFSNGEKNDPPDRILARRILASYCYIDFDSHTISRLSLVSGVLSEILELIVEHHKAVHGLDATDEIAILINVDELNHISTVKDYKANVLQTSDGRSASEIMVRDIADIIRKLSMKGINGSPVIPLIAGTAHLNLLNALDGSGIELSPQSMPVLTSEQVFATLRNCGVSEQYLKNADFLRLLDQSGGIPRIIRRMFEQLTVNYDPRCIPYARKAALEYLNSKSGVMSVEASLGLIPTVVLGERVVLNKQIPGSMETYDSLQKRGAVWLVPVESDMYLVTIPLLSLRVLVDKNVEDAISRRVSEVLDILDHMDWGTFELFCASVSALKMYRLSRTLPSVTMRKFYGDVDMSPEVAKLEIQLSATKDYCTERLNSSMYSRFPPLPDQAKDATKAEKTETAAVGFLTRGKTIINVEGASVDCVMVDPLTKKPDEMLVRALCIAYTDKDLELSKKKFDADREKAILAFETCSTYSNAKCITVHFTNRTVSKDIALCSKGCTACAEKTCIKNSIVVGQHNLAAFFGPVLARGMWSNTHLIRNLLGTDSDDNKSDGI